MNYESKYIEIITGIPYSEYPPKMFMDFWISKPSLKRQFKDSYQYYSIFGAFGFYLSIVIKWGHVERAKNKFELQIEESVNRFMESFKGDKE